MAELLVYGLKEKEIISVSFFIKKEIRRWEGISGIKIKINFLDNGDFWNNKKKIHLKISEDDKQIMATTQNTLETVSIELVSRMASILDIRIGKFYRWPNSNVCDKQEEGANLTGYRIEEI